MRFTLAPILLVLPFILYAKADYKECTEYDENRPVAWWSREIQLAAPGFIKSNQYTRSITINHTTRFKSEKLQVKSYRYNMGIDFNSNSNDQRGLISAASLDSNGEKEVWKFNLLHQNGEIIKSYWLKSNDHCYIPQGPLHAVNGAITVQYKKGKV